MCLGIPGRVTRWIETDPLFALATVEFGGVRRDVHMACAPEAKVDDFVLVHAGIALCVVDEAEAEKTLRDLRRLTELGEETIR